MRSSLLLRNFHVSDLSYRLSFSPSNLRKSEQDFRNQLIRGTAIQGRGNALVSGRSIVRIGLKAEVGGVCFWAISCQPPMAELGWCLGDRLRIEWS